MLFRDIPSSIVMSGSVTEPVTTAQAKAHSRVTTSDDDTYIDLLVTAARRQLEIDTRRTIPQQTLTLRMDCFPSDAIFIRQPPVQSITSITYTATDGTSTTWATADWQSNLTREPPIVVPAYGDIWPSVRVDTLSTVTLVATAGFATVPELYKHAIKLLVGHWYENREAVVDAGSLSETPLAYQRIMTLLCWGDY